MTDSVDRAAAPAAVESYVRTVRAEDLAEIFENVKKILKAEYLAELERLHQENERLRERMPTKEEAEAICKMIEDDLRANSPEIDAVYWRLRAQADSQ